jgi:hypothetical protein
MDLWGWHNKLEQFLKSYIRSLFPRRVYPSERVMHILKAIYPSLNWNEIRFFEGIPWFAKYVAPYVTAQALPATYRLRKLDIHVKNYDEGSCSVLADIVHEAYHIVQYERFGKAWGLGFLRAFIVYYNACFITRGYRNNPFEIPAYEQEYAFHRFCTAHRISPANPYDLETLNHLVDQTQLRTHFIEYKYEGKFLHLALSFIFTAMVAVVKPLAEVLLALNYAVLKGACFALKAAAKVLQPFRKSALR